MMKKDFSYHYICVKLFATDEMIEVRFISIIFVSKKEEGLIMAINYSPNCSIATLLFCLMDSHATKSIGLEC